LQKGRQREIDQAILRYADSVMLYDQPYEDTSRLRVAGTFTVESLSPHRVLSEKEERPASMVDEQGEAPTNQFENMIIDYLKRAGIQNSQKSERLKFDRLEPYAGAWIQAAGEYTESSGATKRVAVSIGPERNIVDSELIREAAKEAVQGLGFDLLVVCGFGFDPYINEEVKRFGRLTVLKAYPNNVLQ
jgi:adenine-specific DNA-methyltransferase